MLFVVCVAWLAGGSWFYVIYFTFSYMKTDKNCDANLCQTAEAPEAAAIIQQRKLFSVKYEYEYP